MLHTFANRMSPIALAMAQASMQTLRSTLFTFSVLATVVVSLAVSCKPKPTATDTCADHPESCNSVLVAKEFFLFKPGSWWVYEEEYSGVRDSMYVYSYANAEDYNFDIVIKSALDNFQYHYWPEYNGQPNDSKCSKTSPVVKKCMNIKRSKYIPGAPGVFVSESRCMFFQFNLKDSVGYFNNNNLLSYIHISEIKNQYQLGTNEFGQTLKVFDRHDGQSRYHPTYHYFSKGVGLVRLELADTTETWNLVNYHIEL